MANKIHPLQAFQGIGYIKLGLGLSMIPNPKIRVSISWVNYDEYDFIITHIKFS